MGLCSFGKTCLAFLLLGGGASLAANKDFTGAVDSDWNTDGNWNPAGVPGAADNVFVLAPGGSNKTINLASLLASNTVVEVGLAREGNGVVTVNHSTGTLNVTSWFNLGQGGGVAPNGGAGVWNLTGNALLNLTHAAGGQTVIGVGFAAAPDRNTGLLTLADSARLIQSTNEIRVGGETVATRANGTLAIGGNALLQNTGAGWLVIGQGLGTGTVTVAANGRLLNTGDIALGNAGRGLLRLQESGSVTGAVLHVGYAAAGKGLLEAGGTARAFATGNLIVGAAGRGVCALTNSASLSANWIQLGNAAGAVGAVYQDGGTVVARGGANVANFVLGNAKGGYGYYRLAGGTMGTREIGIGFNGLGVLDLCGGNLVVTQYVNLSRNTGTGLVNVTSGTLDFSAALNTFLLGYAAVGNGFGQLNVAGGLVKLGTRALGFGGLAGGQVNLLPGGTLLAGAVAGANGQFMFDGGTLQAGQANAAFMTGLKAVRVHSGGAVIDTAGYAITIGQALLSPTGQGLAAIAVTDGGAGYVGEPLVVISGGGGSNGTARALWDRAAGTVTHIAITCPGSGYTAPPTVTLAGGGSTQPATVGAVTLGSVISGGLTKAGAGTLTLTGANTYTGATVVNAGTLSLGSATALPPHGTLRLASGAVLNVAYAGGFIPLNRLFVNDVELPAGVYSPGGLANLTGTGALLVGNVDTSRPLHRWSFNGNLKDSTGGSDATVVDVGPNDVALSATAVTLAGGARDQSDYVRLGVNLLPDAQEALTIELWATPHAVQVWSRVFDFGTSVNEYLMMAWSQNANPALDRVSWRDNAGAESMIDNTCAPYALNQPYHVLMTVEPGAGAGGTTRFTWYVAPAGAADLGPARGTADTAYTLANLYETEDNLGRSFYAVDSTASASYDEVRIWLGARNAGEREQLHDAGPDRLGRPEGGVIIIR